MSDNHRYFSNNTPRVGVYLNRAAKTIEFMYVNDEVGILAVHTKHKDAIEDLKKLEHRGVSGIKEIKSKEYDDLNAKKKPKPSPADRWNREEFSARSPLDTRNPPKVAVKSEGAHVVEKAKSKLSHSTLPEEFRPQPGEAP